MKMILSIFMMLISVHTASASGSPDAYFKGKVIGINGEDVTILTSQGNKVTVKKANLDPPQDSVKVNQLVSVKIVLPIK